ncbi:unnamed protein product [Rotaria sordida]|uniref:Tubby C-terminal domain-containing protein n=1 Tax=Rotaria sordida TaxID=392033 RepID=A0A815J3I2_9BILA|nr:unnamed protein product [Rotaria sordida]CAF1377081.1 unnamed protein product [Rotaria sordida]
MPHNVTRDPCRIVDSESDDEKDNRLRTHVQIATRPATPKVVPKRSPPKIVDWGASSNESTTDKTQYSHNTLNPSNDNASLSSTTQRSSSADSSLESNKQFNRLESTTTTPQSPSASSTDFDPIALIQEDLNNFIYMPVPKEYSSFVQCRLRRDTTGVQKGFFPTFYLQAERPGDNKKFFLLAARKVAKVNRQTEYIITTNVETLSKNAGGDGCVGKLRGNNLTGTEYTLYDHGLSPNKSSSKHSNNKESLRRELAAIVYNVNVFGIKGPRQMSAMLPELGHDIQPTKHEDGILDQWRDRHLNYLIQLRNRSPKYNEETKNYVLQFMGNRVAQPSVKNFQMIIENENREEEIIMQFGRVDKETFTCDFRYPLSAIQAFAIALSSFDSRIVRE